MCLQLFVANQRKPSDIINILVANKNKLLRLLADVKPDKGNGTLVVSVMDMILTVNKRLMFYDSCLFGCRGREL